MVSPHVGGSGCFRMRFHLLLRRNYMRRLRNYGTQRPHDFSAKLRQGVVLLAALLLACTLMAGAVSAVDTVSNFQDLQNAFKNGGYYELADSISFEYNATSDDQYRLPIPDGTQVTLDLKGNTITAILNQDKAASSALIVLGTSAKTASLTISDSVGTGGIKVTEKEGLVPYSEDYPASGCIFYVKSGTLTINGGSYETTKSFILSTNGAKSDGAVIKIDGGTFKTSDTGEYVAFYLAGKDNKVTMSDGSITGYAGVEIRSGTFTMTGGSITATGAAPETDPTPITGYSTNAPAALSMTWKEDYGEPTKLEISSGTVTSTNYAAILNAVNTAANGEYSVTVSGDAVVEGKTAIYKELSGAKSIPATITGGTFVVHTFEDMKTYLEAGTNVKLGGPISGTYTDDSDRVYIDKVASTLDLNGKTLTVTRSSGTGNKGFIKINGSESMVGSLTVTDSTGNGKITLEKGGSDGATLFFVSSYGKIIIDDKNIELTAPQSVIGGNGDGTHTPPTIEINGGTLTSTAGAAIFLSAKDSKMNMTGGSVTGKSGLEIVSGTYIISGGTITGTGDYSESVAAPSSGSLEDGSGIVLRTTDSYSGNIALTISDDAKIVSEKGVAIRNYVRDDDLSSKTFSVEIKDSAKIEGTAAAIANQKYTGETPAFTKSTFKLNGGYYKAPSADKLLVGSPAVTYQTGYSMSTEPVQDGYYAPTKTTAPKVEEIVTPQEDGSVKIDPPSSGSLVVEGQTVTINAGTSGSDNSVTLKVTYEDGATVADTGASGKVASVEAEYKAIPLEDTTSGVTGAKVDMTITLTTVDTNLPTITGKLSDAKQTALQAFGSAYTTFKMGPAFVASHEKLAEFNNNVSTITLTFLVPKSWAPESGNIGVVHISDDANPVVTKSGLTVVTTDDGTNWKVTVTSTKKFSGYSTYYAESSSPGPGPQPTYQPVSSSGSGNMENAFRVLFDTQGGSFISPSTGLSYGDKISQPPAPTKDGYTFGGWYKDEACTQSWSFASGIDGDMTLYAKWTPSSGGSSQTVSQTGSATAQQTVKATPAATQAQSTSAATPAPSGTSASGVSPTMTQAPAPVLGALLGLLAAGVLIRRRD